MADSKDAMTRSPELPIEPLPGVPAQPSNQWLWDQMYLGLQQLYRLRLMNAPKDDVEMNDVVLAWADQLATGFRWEESPAEERAIGRAFQAMANTCTAWPPPRLFWQCFMAPGSAAPQVRADLSPRGPVSIQGFTERQLWMRAALNRMRALCKTQQERGRFWLAFSDRLLPRASAPADWKADRYEELQEAEVYLATRPQPGEESTP